MKSTNWGPGAHRPPLHWPLRCPWRQPRSCLPQCQGVRGEAPLCRVQLRGY